MELTGTCERLKKMHLVSNHVQHHKYHIFGISETYLENTDKNEDLKIPGYHEPIRRDVSGHQGGILVYISEDTPALHRPDLEPQDSEIICIELQLNRLKVLVCHCYRAPHKDTLDFCSDVDTILENSSTEFNGFIMLGDTNGRNIEFWDGDKTNRDGRFIKSYTDSVNLEQLIHEPTRIVENCKSCIDHIFTDNVALVNDVGVRPQIASDHCPIFVTLSHKLPRPKCYKRWVWNYKNGDFDKFRSCLLDAPWFLCYNSDNINDIVSNWITMFMSIAEECIPHYETTIRPNDKDFIDSDIRKLMRHRDHFHKLSKISTNEFFKERFRQLRNQVVAQCRTNKQDRENRTDEIMSNPDTASKAWWGKYKDILSNGEGNSIGTLLDGSRIVTDNREKAILLNNFFVSQTELNENIAEDIGDPPQCPTTIEQKILDPVDVYEILIGLDISKATGPDGISNRILKEAAVPIAEPLSHLFNYSLSVGVFPETWKIANVIPIFKKDNPLLCTNYRPISLLCCISKVFEKIMFNHIYEYLKRNKLLSIFQSGFIKGDSTINQLIAICNLLYKNIDCNDEVLAVFLDLTKAFDKVWHKGILFKIKKCGIKGNIYHWLGSYLTNRQQCVVLNGEKSDFKYISAGVPQGSVLGPLLFLIYINDICDDLKSQTFLFADDTSIFCPVKNDINKAAENINNDLQKINAWSKRWLVSLNPKKTVYMLFSTKRNPSPVPPIMIGQHHIDQVKEHKHLGLIFSPCLSWTKHISATIAKVNKRLGILKKYKYRFSRNTLEIGYKSFVRPLIEYGKEIYDTCTKEDSDKLENLQLEAARTVTGTKLRTSHIELYKELGWISLSDRRKISKLVLFHKVIRLKTPVYLFNIFNDNFKNQNCYTRGRNSSLARMPKCNKELCRNSFIPTTIALWNNLSGELRETSSIPAFRKKVKQLYAIKKRLTCSKVKRIVHVAFTQLRVGFCNLNYDLYLKGCSTQSTCACGHPRESAKHYLLDCPLYEHDRLIMKSNIQDEVHLQNPTTQILLYGNTNFTSTQNIVIFQHVCTFIENSQRLL